MSRSCQWKRGFLAFRLTLNGGESELGTVDRRKRLVGEEVRWSSPKLAPCFKLKAEGQIRLFTSKFARRLCSCTARLAVWTPNFAGIHHPDVHHSEMEDLMPI